MPTQRTPQERMAEWHVGAAEDLVARHADPTARLPYFLAAVEGAALVGVVSIAWYLRGLWPWLERGDPVGPANFHPTPFVQIVVVLVVWAATLVGSGAYSRTLCLVDFREFNVLVVATFLALGGLGFVSYLAGLGLSRGFLVSTLILGTVVLLVVRRSERRLVAWMRRNGRLTKPAYVVGSAESVTRLDAVLRREAWTGYVLVGRLDADVGETGEPGELPVVGRVEELRHLMAQSGVRTVIITGHPGGEPERLRRISWSLEGLDADLLVAPALTDVAGPRLSMRNVAGLPLLHVAEPSTRSARGWAKRIADLAVASMLLVLLSPVLGVIAAVIWLADHGPVLSRVQRVGVDGEIFNMLKFRSLRVDARALLGSLRSPNERNAMAFEPANDPRVTRFGRFLRRFSLDELPQLVNVVRGEMSLVGPRPALPSEVAAYQDDVTRRLLVPPGITGLWQVSGRSDLDWEESARLDLYYADNWSLMNDVVIIVKTVRAVIKGAGAR